MTTRPLSEVTKGDTVDVSAIMAAAAVHAIPAGRQGTRNVRETPSTGRMVALWILRDLGMRSAPAMKEVTDILVSGEPAVRAEAAKTLGAMGAAAQSAIPALTEASESLDDYLSQEASKALAIIHWQVAAGLKRP